MDLFRTLVITIAVIVFVGLFIITAYIFYDTKQKLYPPDMTSCPDFWKLRYDGTCMIPNPNDPNSGNLRYKNHIMYKYNVGKDPKVDQYSSLPKFYDSTSVYNGLPRDKLTDKVVVGYYNSDIPYGYDEETPQNNWIDFNHGGWGSFGDPYCAIKKWANVNNIQWDGMASYNKC